MIPLWTDTQITATSPDVSLLRTHLPLESQLELCQKKKMKKRRRKKKILKHMEKKMSAKSRMFMCFIAQTVQT